MERRSFMKLVFGGLGLLAASPLLKTGRAIAASAVKKLTFSNAEWKKKLTLAQYNILREEGTEPSFTSELLHEKRKGIFACIACDLPLFPSDFKYDSGTGWPSFFDNIAGNVETSTDYKLLYPRTEYHCARCGGHHGHVFDDGPKPTGLRYCNNGIALTFIPSES